MNMHPNQTTCEFRASQLHMQQRGAFPVWRRRTDRKTRFKGRPLSLSLDLSLSRHDDDLFVSFQIDILAHANDSNELQVWIGGERQHFKEHRMIHFLPLGAKLLSIKVKSSRWSQQQVLYPHKTNF